MLPQGRLEVVRWSFLESFLDELPMLMLKPLADWVTPAIKLASKQMMQMREVRVRLKLLSPIYFCLIALCCYRGISAHRVFLTDVTMAAFPSICGHCVAFPAVPRS